MTAVLFTVGTMTLSIFLGTLGGASVYGTAASIGDPPANGSSGRRAADSGRSPGVALQ
jgi:hypothetical protein